MYTMHDSSIQQGFHPRNINTNRGLTFEHRQVCDRESLVIRRQKNLDFSNVFFIIGIFGQNQEKVSFLVDLYCSKPTKKPLLN